MVEGSAKLFIPHTSATYEGMFQLHIWYKKKPFLHSRNLLMYTNEDIPLSTGLNDLLDGVL